MVRYCLQTHNIDEKVQLQARGINRRKFIKNSLAGGISVLYLPLTNDVFISSGRNLRYDLSLDSPARFFDGKSCMVHPRAGIVPGAGKNSLPRVVMTMNSLDLSGSDVFRGMHGMQTDDLGNYNTQQHWVTHSDGLFLVYTRRGANNDHVFRHRAPLFMAQVDPVSLQVIRDSERILVPERGARLGNFGVTDVNSHETWVTVSEWMQPRGVEKYGSDGSIFIARIHWDKVNRLFTD